MAKSKLEVQKTFQGETTFLRMRGTLDEHFEGAVLAAGLTGKYLVISLADIERVTSFGIRQWIEFIKKASVAVAETYFIECPPRVIDQFNMVANFGGRGKIISFYAPFRCDQCGSERLQLIQTDRDRELIKTLAQEGHSGAWPVQMRTCPTDGSIEEFADDPKSYLSHVGTQPEFSVAAPVASFLAGRADYDVPGKVRIEKRVFGRSSGILITGVIGDDFAVEKIAEGLEGDVFFDLSGVGRITEQGLSLWRKLMRIVAAGTDRVLILGMPMCLMERLSPGEDLAQRGQVISLFLPYTCTACAITNQVELDVADHYPALSQGRAPEIDCPSCGRAKGSAAPEAVRSRLRDLPNPPHDINPDQFRRWMRSPMVDEKLLSQRRERKKIEKLVEREVSRFSVGRSWALIVMIIVLVVLVGGMLQHRCNNKKKEAGGTQDAAATPTRPAPAPAPRSVQAPAAAPAPPTASPDGAQPAPATPPAPPAASPDGAQPAPATPPAPAPAPVAPAPAPAAPAARPAAPAARPAAPAADAR